MWRAYSKEGEGGYKWGAYKKQLLPHGNLELVMKLFSRDGKAKAKVDIHIFEDVHNSNRTCFTYLF